MAMSRKDYVLLASAFGAAMKEADERSISKASLHVALHKVVEYVALHDHKFDREKFYSYVQAQAGQSW